MEHPLIAAARARLTRPTVAAALSLARELEADRPRVRRPRSDFAENALKVLGALLQRCDIESLVLCKAEGKNCYNALTLADIEADTGLSRRTISRLLQTFEAAGYFTTDSQDRYMKGGYLICTSSTRRLTVKLFEDLGLKAALQREQERKSLEIKEAPLIKRKIAKLFGSAYRSRHINTATPTKCFDLTPPPPAVPADYAEKKKRFEARLAAERLAAQYSGPAFCPA